MVALFEKWCTTHALYAKIWYYFYFYLLFDGGDVLDMVTCIFAERKKVPTPSKEEERKIDEEERWPLRSVVFIEDMRTVQTGKVLKVCRKAVHKVLKDM